MFYFNHYFCFLLISMSIGSVFGSTHAVIGNYSELNPKDCGITRMTNGYYYDKCFEWHKNPMNQLTAGRNVTYDEVPFIARIIIFYNETIRFESSGSLIADQWILTCAHCLRVTKAGNFTIEFGYHSYKSNNKIFKAKAAKIFDHPEYESDSWRVGRPPMNDLSLIKLEKPIDEIVDEDGRKASTEARSVCLPQKGISNTEKEYAMTTGWGSIDPQSIDRENQPLQLGPKIIQVNSSDPSIIGQIHVNISREHSPTLILGTPVEGKTLNCGGDSGGPLWQCDMGRAVLIGITSFHNIKDLLSNCEGANDNPAAWFTKVSLHIKWIHNVILFGTNLAD